MYLILISGLLSSNRIMRKSLPELLNNIREKFIQNIYNLSHLRRYLNTGRVVVQCQITTIQFTSVLNSIRSLNK
jgi:hypothetical protein